MSKHTPGPSDDEIRRLANLPFNQDENGTEWVTLTPKMLARAVRRALATTEPVMENGLTEAETDATASVMGLTTTEPEPTGVPELHPIAHIELGDESHDVVTLEAAKAYGEQCWKAGYQHGINN